MTDSLRQEKENSDDEKQKKGIDVNKINFKDYLSDSLDFTIETFFGNLTRGVILFAAAILLILISVIDPLPLQLHAGTFHWQSLPWPEVIILTISEFVIGAVSAGYGIRIYRGRATPPDFDNFGPLMKDGIKAGIIAILWILPLLIILLIIFTIVPLLPSSSVAIKSEAFLAMLLLLLTLFTIIPVLIIPVSLFHFARTGSFWESFRLSKILSIIHNPGWKKYLVAWAILIAIFLIIIIPGIIIAFLLFIILHTLIPTFHDFTELNRITSDLVGVFSAVFVVRFMTRVLEDHEGMFSIETWGGIKRDETHDTDSLAGTVFIQRASAFHRLSRISGKDILRYILAIISLIVLLGLIYCIGGIFSAINFLFVIAIALLILEIRNFLHHQGMNKK